MSMSEIVRIALVDTALGMGTVFLILLFISVCIGIMGRLCREKPAPAAEVPEGIPPEVVAAVTAAVHQYIRDENGGEEPEYIVRNVRRATWRHTS